MKTRVNYEEEFASYELENRLREIFKENSGKFTGISIACIGTDRNIADAVGPLVGTFLLNKNLPDYVQLIGTIEKPMHAINLRSKLSLELIKGNLVIGIDACLGDTDCVGEIHIRNYPVHPGKGVGKELPSVGDYSIIAITESSEKFSFETNSVRLDFVWKLSKIIANVISNTVKDFKPKEITETVLEAALMEAL